MEQSELPESEYERRRAQMVTEQLRRRGITDEAIVSAMAQVPRERFVLPTYRAYAYDDTPLPIPAGQTISQPFIVAAMINYLQLSKQDRVLEIGCGSGYAAAVISHIASQVHTVERQAALVDYARQRLSQIGCDNVRVHYGDGTLGWPAQAPYQAILVSAGGPRVPPPLIQQLALHGRLVMPVGRQRRQQTLVRYTRIANGPTGLQREELVPVAFVPLIGAQGWTDDK